MPVSLQDTLLRGEIAEMVTPLHAEQAEACLWMLANDKRNAIFGVAVDTGNGACVTGIFPPWLAATGVFLPWLAARLTA